MNYFKLLLCLIFAFSIISCSKTREIDTKEVELKDTTAITASGSSKTAPTLTLKANASDNIGVTRVEFYVNSVKVCTSTSSPYQCDWTPTLPLAANYSLFTKAFDEHGNFSQSTTVTIHGSN